MKNTEFAHKLINWYKIKKRDLPWRHTQDPYRIWLSEIILQQTRVAQGLPYYMKFIENYPTIQDLAKASEAEVLRLWQGLGYYSRARNMHFTAQFVTHQLSGIFPNNYLEIKKLKGIGDYTASAISSFAFGERKAVLDGNVFRVLSRVFGITDDISSTTGKKKFAQIAQDLLPKDESPTYNQAIMEFGALHCIPKNPDCNNCTFSGNCYAETHKQQAELPIKIKKVKTKTRHFLYIIFQYKNQLMLKERTEKDIWKGLYDFPLYEQNSTQNIAILQTIYEETIKQDLSHFMIGKKIQVFSNQEFRFEVKKISEIVKHLLSHQKIYAQFLVLDIPNQTIFQELETKLSAQFYPFETIENLPKPILIADYLKKHFF